MAKDYAKIAQKQIRRAKEATQDYSDGVAGVDVAPGQLAVKKEAKLKNNFNAAVDSGKWRDATAAVSLEYWQKQTTGKGAERFAPGVEAASDDIIAFHADFGPKRDALKRTVDAMPDATPEQRKAKMVANMEGMSKLRRSKKRR